MVEKKEQKGERKVYGFLSTNKKRNQKVKKVCHYNVNIGVWDWQVYLEKSSLLEPLGFNRKG